MPRMGRPLKARGLVVVAVVAALAMAGCPDSEPGATCTTPPAETCAPLYEPTFAQIFARTLRPSCGLGGSSCHSDRGRQGGLAFTNEQESYDLLVRSGVVRAGDAACSDLMVRLMATDGKIRMPPGGGLDPGAKCAIRTWIANGAPR